MTRMSRLFAALTAFAILAVAVVAAPKPASAAPGIHALEPGVVSGASTVGSTLSYSPGSWSLTPDFLSWQWVSCDAPADGECNAIGADNDPSYQVTADDVGRYIQVTEQAEMRNGSGNYVQSNVIGPIAAPAVAPELTGLPQITGDATVGGTLTATPGMWTGTAPITYTYQWERCPTRPTCAPIDGATGSTYTLTADDTGTRLRVIVTAANAGGSLSARSTFTTEVPAVVPANVEPPAVLGDARVGEVLTATPGTWTGTAPITYTYQWLRCDDVACETVDGATGTTYTAAAVDLGSRLRVTVTATNGAGSADAFATTGPVAPIPLAGPAPVVTGIARVGETLTATVGGWEGSGPITYTWAWQRCAGITCVAVPGSTDTYVVQPDDVDSTLRAVVTVTGAAETTQAASAPTATVIPAPGGDLDSNAKSNGQTITISGSNWQPGSQVSVTLHSDPVFLGYATAGDDGTFTATFPIPAGTPGGAHHVVLDGLDAAGNPATVELAVTINVPDDPGPSDPPAPPAGPRDLPRTGTDTVPLFAIGVAALVTGAFLVTLSRRREVR